MRIVAALLVLAGAAAQAQDAEWQSIFNGRDLTGWKPVTGAWRVEQDEIVGRARGEFMAWLILEGEHTDLEVDFEFMTPQPANGGLQFRSHWMPREPVPPAVALDQIPLDMYGYQANIDTQRAGATGAVMAKHGDPPLAVASEESQGGLKGPREWNRMTVRAVGPDIEVVVNGVTACRVQDHRYRKGTLALQVVPNKDAQATEVRYRNLRMRDLGPGAGWRPLFNGRDLAGWTVWGTEKWSVEDGAIVGRSGPKGSEGYLATEETFKDFDVRGTFKMLGAGNFGLFYHSTIRYNEDEYPMIAGLQGEVDPTFPGPTGWVYESYKRGWLVPPDVSRAAAYAMRPGDWNEIHIRAVGNRIQTWVNGFPVLDLTDPAQQLFEGSFALQLHTGGTDGILWKDLYVRAP